MVAHMKHPQPPSRAYADREARKAALDPTSRRNLALIAHTKLLARQHEPLPVGAASRMIATLPRAEREQARQQFRAYDDQVQLGRYGNTKDVQDPEFARAFHEGLSMDYIAEQLAPKEPRELPAVTQRDIIEAAFNAHSLKD